MKTWVIVSNYKYFEEQEDGKERIFSERQTINGFDNFEIAESFLTTKLQEKLTQLKENPKLLFLSVHDGIKTPNHSFEVTYQLDDDLLGHDAYVTIKAQLEDVMIHTEESLETLEPVLF